MFKSRALLAGVALIGVVVLTGCTGEPEPEATTGGGVVTIEVLPAQPTADALDDNEHKDDEEDAHGVVSGDEDDVPTDDAFIPIAEAASAFVVAMFHLDWDHQQGPAQWITAVEPYSTPSLLEQFQSNADSTAGGWGDFMAGKNRQSAEVRTVAPDYSFAFDEATLVVTVEYATVIATPAVEPYLGDSPSQFLQLRMVDSGQGSWLVSEISPAG